MLKNIFFLAVCQALMLSSTSLTMTSSALVGMSIAPKSVYATLPLGICYLTVMMSLVPASLAMQRFGRKPVFYLGACSGFAGGVLAASGIYVGSFVLFCIGAIFQGVAMSTAQFYRFAAAELADESYRSRAISWVLAGGLVAAFLGPAIAFYTREISDLPLFTLSFGSIAVVSFGILVCLSFIRFSETVEQATTKIKRPLRTIVLLPGFATAVICAMVAYGSMNLLMTATPLAMDQRGLSFEGTTMVIQWHIVGMFAPSFFTGNLIHRFGVLKIMVVGVFMLLICIISSNIAQDQTGFLVSLFCLGVGWNFLYIGGTTLLTQVYRPSEKGLVQGINDFVVFSMVATTALISGYLHHLLGWVTLNLIVLPALTFALASIFVLHWQNRTHPKRVPSPV